MAMSKKDMIEVLLASESLTSDADFETKIRCADFIRHKFKKFDVNQISLFEQVSDNLKHNKGLRNQFKELVSEFEEGYFDLPPDKAVTEVQRKRGYHDKGTLAPEEERIRKAIDELQVVDLTFLDDVGHRLPGLIFNYLPYRYFTEKQGDRIYLWIPQMEDYLSGLDWQENADLNEIKSSVYFELQDYLDEFLWLEEKLLR